VSNAARQVRHALAEALGVMPRADTSLETVDVAGAAALLHTTVRGIYDRRRCGKMPRPLTKRPLVWRTADVLAMRE
jgi:hypothetical protein